MMTQEQAEAAAREIDRACGIVLIREGAPPWEIASTVEDILGARGVCAYGGRLMMLRAGAFITMTKADVEWATDHYCQFWLRLPTLSWHQGDEYKWQRVSYPCKNLARELLARARSRASTLPTPAEVNAAQAVALAGTL